MIYQECGKPTGDMCTYRYLEPFEIETPRSGKSFDCGVFIANYPAVRLVDVGTTRCTNPVIGLIRTKLTNGFGRDA